MIPVILAALGAAAPLAQLGFQAMTQIAPALAPAIARALAGKVPPKLAQILGTAGRIVGKVAAAVDGDPAVLPFAKAGQVVAAVNTVAGILAPALEVLGKSAPEAPIADMPDIKGSLAERLLNELAAAEANADAASDRLAQAIARAKAGAAPVRAEGEAAPAAPPAAPEAGGTV